MSTRAQARQVAELARVMMVQAAPSVRHATWLLALLAMADGDPVRAHEWLCSEGEKERMCILPRFPMEVADEVRLVHMRSIYLKLNIKSRVELTRMVGIHDHG